MNASSISSDAALPLDVHIGRRIEQFRTLAGISPEKLAEDAGVDIKIIRAYEAGTCSIFAADLFYIAQVLRQNVEDFATPDH
jgi:transcriptional regulator with XRE-family HTH domain